MLVLLGQTNRDLSTMLLIPHKLSINFDPIDDPSYEKLWLSCLTRATFQSDVINKTPLPIEAFKDCPHALFQDTNKGVTRFLSSGTTNIAARSQSFFSKHGLELYKRASLVSFYEVLKHYFEEPFLAEGYSLIPPTTDWRDSSLAQMIEWFQRSFNMEYVNETKPRIVASKPCWVFGTGFHFVKLFDLGFRQQLHPQSIVIETGGTKGKTRAVSSEALSAMLQEMFGLSSKQIVSEYGMCELAAQAYRLGKDEEFRFPPWVQCFIEQDKPGLLQEGVGSLTIFDPLRIDYKNAIRTQDLAHLKQDAFTLKGRLPATALKGCSSLVNLEYDSATFNKSPLHKAKTNDNLNINFSQLSGMIAAWLSSGETKEALKECLVDDKIIELATRDMIEDLPKSDTHWQTALQKAETEHSPHKKLIIAPQTHPLSILYPVFFSMLLGHETWLRPSRSCPDFYHGLVNFLKTQGLHLYLTNSDYQLTERSDEWGGVFIFGSDDSLVKLSLESSTDISGSGTKTGIVICSNKELNDLAPHILKDAVSLAQLGCLSARVLFVTTEADESIDLSAISGDLHSLLQIKLPQPYRIRQFQDYCKLSGNYCGNQSEWENCLYEPGSLLVASQSFDFNKKLDDYLLPIAFSLPLIKIAASNQVKLLSWLNNQTGIVICAASPSMKLPLKTQSIGKLNRLIWDGTLDDRPLFQSLGYSE